MAKRPRLFYGDKEVKTLKIVYGSVEKECFDVVDGNNKKIYHKHHGGNGTGCYTKANYCGGSITAKQEQRGCGGYYQPNYTYRNCSKCGQGESYCNAYPSCSRGGSHNVITYYGSKCSSCGRSKESTSGYPSGSCDNSSYSTYYSCNRCGTRYGGGGTCNRLDGYGLGCGYE